MDLSQSEYNLTNLAILRCEKYARPANRLIRAEVLNQPTSHAHKIFPGLQGQNACVLITTACRRVVGDSVDNVASKELAPEAGVALLSVARPCLHGLHLCQGTLLSSFLLSPLLSFSSSYSPRTSSPSSARARPLYKRSRSPGSLTCFFFASPLHTWRGRGGHHHQHRHRQFPSKNSIDKVPSEPPTWQSTRSTQSRSWEEKDKDKALFYNSSPPSCSPDGKNLLPEDRSDRSQ